MTQFRVWWNHKDHRNKQAYSLMSGDTIADAFRRSGYGGGAVNAVDYYEEIQPGQLSRIDVIEFIEDTGSIPAHHDCPFRSECAMGPGCLHAGKNHRTAFSCGAARGFVITEGMKKQNDQA